MANPKVIFLDQPGSIAEQVAGVLLEGLEGNPYDLTSSEVWVPTAGAARRIRHKLAELSAKRGGGVLSPKFSKPMAALLPRSGKGGVIASRVDREAAWGLVLRDVEKSTVATLFPSPEVLDGEQFLVGAAAMMCELCDRLAEGGKTPIHPKIIEVCSDDVGRWQEMDPLYRSYLSVLSRHGLQDPNELKIRGEEGSLPSMKRLFIACVPDLQSVAEKRAARLMEQGVEVCVLVWKPRPMDGQFDPWGRPKTGYWIDALIPLQPDQIQMAKDPADEAAGAVEFLAGAGGSHAIILGDPKLSATFQAEILRSGGSPFLPEGKPLARTEAAVVAAEWIKFRADQSLRTLRRLLELPGFSAWIGAQCGLSLHELLACCDYLTIDLLAESLSQAEAFLVGTSRAKETRFLGILSASLALGAAELVKEIWSGKADLVEDVLDACAEVKASPVARTWPEAVDPLLLRSFSRRSVYGSSKPTDTDLAGWLEAPWCDAQRLAVCGCVEGSLPSSLDGHPFLPDAVRGSLGIADNSSLRARDHYLLACLIHSQAARPHGKILCSFSKFGPDGSPSTPSGLLMRCPSEQLPERVIRLFQKSASGVARPKRKPEWRWSLPQVAQRGEPRISPTDFKKYLECPFRFYLSRRLGLETHDQGAREMHPGQFGELIHGALQRFAEHSRDEINQNKISKAVLGHLEDLTMEMFGSDPSPAVRVQIQAAKIRLQSFARVQHGLRDDGWKIIAWEKKIESGALGSSLIGGLPLSGKIDRLDEHDEKGLRVIDYKTQGKLTTPQKAHFASRSFLEEARVPGDGRALYWKDLQLPIYRKIVEALNPGRPIETAYLALTADPQESRILSLPLNEGLMESAQRCAEEVGSRVRRGVFWPPRSLPSNARDPYDVLFKDGTFEQCINEATIAFLKGVEDRLP